MQEAGWDIRVIVLAETGFLADELQAAGVPVIRLGLTQKYNPVPIFQLERFWRAEPPDLIHTHLYHAGLIGRTVARIRGLGPVVVHQHGAEKARSGLRSWLDRSTTNWVQCYIASCRAVAETLEKRENVAAARIAVIYNGLDRSTIQQPSQQALKPDGWPVPDGTRSIVCVGRLSPEKGQKWLVQALSQLDQQEQPVHLVLIGDGDSRGDLQEQVLQLGLTEQVHLLGARKDVPDWLPHFDLFVLPSAWEGVSLALLEAMAAGLPVIATESGGTPEVVEAGVTGLLVPPGNPTKLAEAIQILLSDGDLRKKMGSAGQERVRSKFTAEETIRQMDRLYQRMLGENKETR
jgi:glycosyltransferase involved in cell wall biosynthesis